MNAFGLFEAKNKFSELVARAQAGDDVVVTKHGRPVARIVAYANPAEAAERVKRQQESVARVGVLRSRLARRVPIGEITARPAPGRG